MPRDPREFFSYPAEDFTPFDDDHFESDPDVIAETLLHYYRLMTDGSEEDFKSMLPSFFYEKQRLLDCLGFSGNKWDLESYTPPENPNGLGLNLRSWSDYHARTDTLIEAETVYSFEPSRRVPK